MISILTRNLCTLFAAVALSACQSFVVPAEPTAGLSPGGELLIAPKPLPRLDSAKPMPLPEFLEVVAADTKQTRDVAAKLTQLQAWGRIHNGWTSVKITSAEKDGTTDADADPALRPLRDAVFHLHGAGVEEIGGPSGGVYLFLPGEVTEPEHTSERSGAVDMRAGRFVPMAAIPDRKMKDAAPLVRDDVGDFLTVAPAAEPVENDVTDPPDLIVAAPSAFPKQSPAQHLPL